MAGVKGRSGGARPNTGGARPNSGGARPGAGRKPKTKPVEPEIPAKSGETPLEFLLSVQNSALASPSLRVRAAIAAAQYVHTKRGDGGKKEADADKAKTAAAGKYGVRQGPRLVSSK